MFTKLIVKITYVSQIIMLYALNLYSVVCQLCLRKLEEKLS